MQPRSRQVHMYNPPLVPVEALARYPSSCTRISLFYHLSYHSLMVSPFNFARMFHLPCSHIRTLASNVLFYHSASCSGCYISSLRMWRCTHICLPEQISCAEGYEASVHEGEECCAWCPAEIAPAVFVELCRCVMSVSALGFYFPLRILSTDSSLLG
jgi:hypothetical protein